MNISRNLYLNQLVAGQGNGLIKIVTGIRLEERTTDKNNKTIRKQYEVDFVANQGNKRYYIQSAFAIPDEAKVRQETASLTRIDDSFKKIIVVKDDIMPKRDENGIVKNGIVTIGIMDFLLRPDSLDY